MVWFDKRSSIFSPFSTYSTYVVFVALSNILSSALISIVVFLIFPTFSGSNSIEIDDFLLFPIVFAILFGTFPSLNFYDILDPFECRFSADGLVT